MKTVTVLCVVLFAAACGKKADKPAPAPEQKVVEKKVAEPVAPARMTVTTKSPEAKAAYDKAHDLAMNLRFAESVPDYKKAVELDPEFAVATAELGFVTPGAEGTDLLTKAGTLAAKVSDPEKAWIEAFQAARAGDPVKAIASLDKVVQLAPGTWEADLWAANMSNNRNDAATALKHLEHLTSIKADVPQAQNGLAYAYANQREWDKAIAAAKKQVELLPKEPNPADTLGEIELWAGKFDDSEKDFAKATELDPNFFGAWQGVGLARAYRGDFKGSYEAYDKMAASTAPGQKYEAMLDRAWLQLSENKAKDAFATLDAIDKDADSQKYPISAYAAADRAMMLQLTGKYADSTKALATAKERTAKLPGAAARGLNARYRIGTLRAAAMQGKPAADADKLLADAAEDAKAMGDDKLTASSQAWMKGLAAWAKGGAKDGPKAAIAELSNCSPESVFCRYDLALATRKAGDAAAADALDKQLAETPRRTPEGVYVKTHPTKSVK